MYMDETCHRTVKCRHESDSVCRCLLGAKADHNSFFSLAHVR